MAIKLDKPSEFDESQIEAFEAKNPSRGKVQKVQFESDADPEKPAQFWVAKPNRLQIEAITDTAKTGSSAKGNDLLINTCVLAGDLDQLADDTDLFFGLLESISDLVNTKKKI